jgi:hypothetical protein
VRPRLALASGGGRSVLPELKPGVKLLHVVEGWLRKEKEARQAREREQRASGAAPAAAPVAPTRTPFDMPSKHLAFFR